MIQHQIIKQFLSTLAHIDCGSLHVTLPSDKKYEFSGKSQGPSANIIIHDIRAISSFANKGDIGFAESYRDGWWNSTDLTELFLFCLKNEENLNKYFYGNLLSRIASRLSYYFTRNTIKGSKNNIHAHYDIGNEFYKLMLDPGMTYSSAIFADKSEDLISAQQRKYDRILDRLNNSGSLLEIGCGWGGFAEHALKKADYSIKGLTISNEQYNYARHRLKDDALIALEDYRIQHGKYNHIVSIEMFEAVGEKFWPIYFNQLKSLLASKGKAIIQTITIKEQYFERYRKSGDFIRSYIFPGGMLPSPESFISGSTAAGLKITDSFAFGNDYSLTVKHWLDRFEENLSGIKALGFDDKFIRMWRFYLASCIASFTDGRTNVMQLELQHA